MDDLISGRCLCGAVRFSFDRPPITIRACWCRDCQFSRSASRPDLMVIWTGSAPGWISLDAGLRQCEGQPPALPAT